MVDWNDSSCMWDKHEQQQDPNVNINRHRCAVGLGRLYDVGACQIVIRIELEMLLGLACDVLILCSEAGD